MPFAESRPEVPEIHAIDDDARACQPCRRDANHARGEIVRMHEAYALLANQRGHPPDAHGDVEAREASHWEDVWLETECADRLEENPPSLETAEERLESLWMPPQPLDQLSLDSSIVEAGQQMEDADGPHGLLDSDHGVGRATVVARAGTWAWPSGAATARRCRRANARGESPGLGFVVHLQIARRARALARGRT
jgi:hypothetical protein